ncbi:MAG: hypothetical protein AAGH65_02870 [Pseudomonadota bacterium]
MNVHKLLPSLALAALIGAAPAQAQEAPASPSVTLGQQAAQQRAQLANWLTRAAEAYNQQDYAAWAGALEQLHQARPFNADFMRQLVMAHAMSGDTARAFNMMLIMQQQGLAENWDEVDEVASLRQFPLYEHLNRLMSEAGEPLGTPEVVATIEGRYSMPEALAHDRRDGRLFAGTIRDGQILVRSSEQDWTVFASNDTIPGLMSVFDLLADEARNHLWVATGAAPQYRNLRATDFGRTALIKLDLQSGELLGEYRITPDGLPHVLGAMVLASDGTVYAADTLSPLVYRLSPDSERPEVIFGNPIFTGLRGIALSKDEQRIYISDYELGIFFFDLDDERRGFRMGTPENLNAAGIDGLYRWNDSLVAIQNGISPQRVMRLDLDESGTRVANVAPLVVAQPQFDTPTFGTLEGNELFFLAASHWSRVDQNGTPLQRPLPDIPIMRVNVEEAPRLVVGAEMLEEMKRRSRQGTVNPPQN